MIYSKPPLLSNFFVFLFILPIARPESPRISPSISSWAGPEFGQRQGFEQEFHELSQSPGEPGEFASGDLAGLTVGGFFSAGAGFSAWSHMPVETAQ